MNEINERFSRSWWREQYYRQANNPRVWELKAAELEYAAEILWEKQKNDFPILLSQKSAPPALAGISLMLFGLAIELLAKSLFVSKQTPINAKNKISFSKHDLPTLVSEAGCRLSTSDRHFLERLKQFVEWAGRYPVPKMFEPMQPSRWPNGSFGPAHTMSGNDILHARKIIRRLARKMNQPRIRSDVWRRSK
jgi:hypothetical protein